MKHHHCLCTLVVWGMYLPYIFAQTPTTPAAKIHTEAFLTQAVLSGLAEDVFPKEAVRYILENQERFFVPKCPICSPVKRAFSRYTTQPPPSYASKVQTEFLLQLQHQDRNIAQEAFKILIDRYITQAISRANFTRSQHETLKQDLAMRRKRGISHKSDTFGKFCPSCEGACQVK